MKESILVIAAHNDDAAIGAGGTLLKYVDEGKDVNVIIFSYGEGSHPHLKPELIKKKRLEEANASNKFMGIKCLGYFDLNETKFPQQIEEKNIKKRLKHLIKEAKPDKIFTHSIDDPMPDHRAVYNLVMDLAEKLKLKSEIYTFDVWNIVNFRNREKPKLIVDVSKTFDKKIKAIQLHKSQKATIVSLLWKIMLKDWLNGIGQDCKYAEAFVKIK